MSTEETTTSTVAAVETAQKSAPKKPRKTPSKKETEHLTACHSRNAVIPIKKNTHAKDESMTLISMAGEDFLRRVIEKAASYGNERKTKQHTVSVGDIIDATQVEPMFFPTYVLDGFEPKPRKPRVPKPTENGEKAKKPRKPKAKKAKTEVEAETTVQRAVDEADAQENTTQEVAAQESTTQEAILQE